MWPVHLGLSKKNPQNNNNNNKPQHIKASVLIPSFFKKAFLLPMGQM